MAKTPTEIKSLARLHTKSALKTLVGIMNEPSAPPAARVQAAQALLDRGWGKATVHIESDNTHTYVLRLPEVARSVEEWQNSVLPGSPNPAPKLN